MATIIRHPITRNLISVPPPTSTAPGDSTTATELTTTAETATDAESTTSTANTTVPNEQTPPAAETAPPGSSPSTEQTRPAESSDQNPNQSEEMKSKAIKDHITTVSNVLASANASAYARYFLAEYESSEGTNMSIAALGAGTNPGLPAYSIPDGYYSDEEFLVIGKLFWRDPTAPKQEFVPEHPSRMGKEWQQAGMQPYGSDADKRGPNPDHRPSTSLLDIEDEDDDGEGNFELKRSKIAYSIHPGIIIQRQRPSCMVKNATLSKQTIGKGWKIKLDNGQTWKVENKTDEEGALLWKDQEGKELAVEYLQSSQWGYLGQVELRLLDKFDEDFRDFIVAAWIARIADEVGGLPKVKVGTKVGRVKEKLRNKVTLPLFLPMD